VRSARKRSIGRDDSSARPLNADYPLSQEADVSVNDFVAAWNKLMNLDRLDLA